MFLKFGIVEFFQWCFTTKEDLPLNFKTDSVLLCHLIEIWRKLASNFGGFLFPILTNKIYIQSLFKIGMYGICLTSCLNWYSMKQVSGILFIAFAMKCKENVFYIILLKSLKNIKKQYIKSIMASLVKVYVARKLRDTRALVNDDIFL